MSTEKNVRELPSTDEAQIMALAQRGVEDLAGTILLDRYRLVELRGSGGAAVVYRALHTIMHKTLAVKILRPEHAVRQDYVQRFLAEARAVAKLRHENIVDIVDIGRTESGLVFCVMEYLEGEELADTLDREGPMPWQRARDIVVQVCEALAAAHAVGIVHRDVKPQNCFRITHAGNPDFIKLLDFGIAKQTTDQAHRLTATGVIMGTAEYMSPEQCRGHAVDARSDGYSVGAMLFELLSGRPPFEGETFVDVVLKQISERPPRLSLLAPRVHRLIDVVIDRALAKRPEDRYASMADMVAALDEVHESTQRMAVPVAVFGASTSDAHSLSVVRTRVGDHDRTLAAIALLFGAMVIAVLVAVGGYALEHDPPRTADPSPATSPAPTPEPPRTDDRAPPPVHEEERAKERDPIQAPHQNEGDASTPGSEPSVIEAEVEPKRREASSRSTVTPRDRRKHERRIHDACASETYSARTVTIKVGPSKSATVNVSPVYRPLKDCVERAIGPLSPGYYAIKFEGKATRP
jgi:serine/threonine protein kinase